MTAEFLNQRSWQKIAETKIQQAMREGKFDSLQGFGKPFEFDDQNYDPNDWIKSKIKREGLSLLPPALRLRREVERRTAGLMKAGDEANFVQQLDTLNCFIEKANRSILWGPPSDVIPLDRQKMLAIWKQKQHDGEPPENPGG